MQYVFGEISYTPRLVIPFLEILEQNYKNGKLFNNFQGQEVEKNRHG